jgi:purine-binding chemotaxis protein CheW
MMANVSEQQTSAGLLVAVFLVGRTAFGLDTARVQEVVRVGGITPVHHAPPYVTGLRNLRGRIVTVVDLRERLDLEAAELGPESRILIVDWEGESVGLLVDRVVDTLAVDPDAIEPPPPNLNGVQGRNLRGVCRNGGGLVALLDLEPVLDPGGGPADTTAAVAPRDS